MQNLSLPMKSKLRKAERPRVSAQFTTWTNRTIVWLTVHPSPSRSDSDSSAYLLFLVMEFPVLNSGCHTQHSIACRAASEENLRMNPQGSSYCSYWVLALSRVHHYLGHLLDLRKVAALPLDGKRSNDSERPGLLSSAIPQWVQTGS